MQLSAIDDSKKVVMFFTLPSQYLAVFSIILTKLSYLHHDIAAHNVTFNSFSSFDTCLRFVCVIFISEQHVQGENCHKTATTDYCIKQKTTPNADHYKLCSQKYIPNLRHIFVQVSASTLWSP